MWHFLIGLHRPAEFRAAGGRCGGLRGCGCAEHRRAGHGSGQPDEGLADHHCDPPNGCTWSSQVSILHWDSGYFCGIGCRHQELCVGRALAVRIAPVYGDTLHHGVLRLVGRHRDGWQLVRPQPALESGQGALGVQQRAAVSGVDTGVAGECARLITGRQAGISGPPRDARKRTAGGRWSPRSAHSRTATEDQPARRAGNPTASCETRC